MLLFSRCRNEHDLINKAVFKGTQPRQSSRPVATSEEEETREMLRKSKSTVRAQVICNIASAGIIVICIGFTAVNLTGLLGGVLS